MLGDTTAKRRDFAGRLALFYAALFVVYGMHVPYMPVWLDWRGLTASEISTVMAAPFFLRLFITPLAALSADRTGSHRRLIIVLAWLGLALVLLLSQAASFWPVLMLTVPLIICNSTIMPLTETLAVQGVRTFGADYGRMRLWGSLTFIAASFAGGFVIEHFGRGSGVWLVALGCALTVAAALALPVSQKPDAGSVRSDPIWKAREPRELLGSRAFVWFLLASGLVQASHATFMTFGALIWQKQGYSGGLIGALWAIGVLTEVLLFAYSSALLRLVTPVHLLIIGAAVAVVRWAISAFDPPLAAVVPLAALHGVTYGATHIGAIHFMNRAVPRHALGSAQALYATISAGVAMGAATLLAGSVYASHGSFSYLAMASVAALALTAAIILQKIWNGGLVVPEWAAEPVISPKEPALEAP